MAIGANLTKRDQILISAMVLAIALAGAYGYFLYMPKRDAARGDRGACRGARQEERSRRKADARERQRREAQAAGCRVPGEPQGACSCSCRRRTKCRRCSRTSRRPRAASDSTSHRSSRCRCIVGEQFDTYRYKVSVKGGYHALAGFLTNVGSLNRIVAPVALDVKQQTAADKKKARPKEGESTLDTDFQIQTYIAHPASDRRVTLLRRR